MATVLGWIRRDLEAFGVRFDNWFSERSLYQPGAWESVEKQLRERDLLFEQEGALWFRSTRFGDDKDRVVVKNDGSRTYLASDILYHADKFRRGFERVIDIWGADHHGYIPRMQAVAQALGQPADALAVRLIQLVTLTRGGKAVAMGKREGEFVTLAEVVGEVGADAARFFFVMRRCESHLEFDLELAKSKTADNPVFYVQYAHARIASIFRTQTERGAAGADEAGADLGRLELPEELGLIKRLAGLPRGAGRVRPDPGAAPARELPGRAGRRLPRLLQPGPGRHRGRGREPRAPRARPGRRHRAAQRSRPDGRRGPGPDVSDRVADTPGRPGASALRVGLTLGGIVLAAVVIFGLGVMEGSRVAERVPEVAAPPSALPTETLQPQPSAPVAPAATLHRTS